MSGSPAPASVSARRHRKLLIAALLLVAALGIRISYDEFGPSYRPINDGAFYLRLATEIDRTGAYSTADAHIALHTRGPSAYFPPGYPYFLAGVDLVDGHRGGGAPAVQPARIAQAVLGTATVALLGLVALELFGSAVALIALALAAVDPLLFVLGGTLTAENLLLALELAAVWCALRARRSPRPYGWIAGAGVLAGLATLTHLNGAVVVLVLAFAVWTSRPRWSTKALAAPALLVVGAMLVIAPWTIRNAVVMHRFIPISDEAGITLAGTYNPTSAADARVPYRWRPFFGIPEEAPLINRVLHGPGLSEPELSGRLLSDAVSYIGAHPLAPLAVGYHNTRRLLELEGSYASHVSAAAMGIGPGPADLVRVGFWILAAVSMLGACTRAARAAPRWLWVVPLLLVLSVVLVNAETPRFRAPIEPFLILLAALALANTRASARA